MEKKAEAKRADADEQAFDKLVASNEEFRKAVRQSGKPRILAVFKAGVRRGKNSHGGDKGRK